MAKRSAMRRASSGISPTIGLISPCGWGNLGEDAQLEAMIGEIRRRCPGAQFRAFTMNPAETTRRHGIPAFPMSGYSPPGFSIVLDFRLARAAKRFGDILDRQRFGIWRLSKVWRRLCGVAFDLGHVVFAGRMIRGLDLLILGGSSQLDDVWGGPLGNPWALFKWAMLARLTRTPLLLLSVAFGPIRSPWSKFLLRQVIRAATYRSYRDPVSRDEAAEQVPGEHLHAPDLAFGMYPPPARIRGGDPARLTIGVSPMAYLDPRAWPDRDASGYARQIGVLAAFVARRLEEGHTIELFVTNHSDRLAVEDLKAALPERIRADFAAAIREPQANTIGRADNEWNAVPRETPLPVELATAAHLLRALRSVDLVVASRLHGVMLSHVAGIPVLALSYDRKVHQHMVLMGEESSCLSIEHSSLETLESVFQLLVQQREEKVRRIQARIAVQRRALAAQYDRVLAPWSARWIQWDEAAETPAPMLTVGV